MILRNTPLFWAKAFYFCFYAAGAALMPFIVLYYQGLGLSGRQIGFLAGIYPLVGLVGAPIWGAFADASRRHKSVLTFAIVGAVGLALLLSRVSSFNLVIPVVILFAFFASPIIPLADNAVLSLLASLKAQYGHQRIWGAIGWGIAGPLIGQLVETRGLNWSFWGYAGFLMLGVLVIQPIPFRRVKGSFTFWRGARTLLSNRAWLAFLFLAFVGGMGQAVIHNFLFLHMNDLGANPFENTNLPERSQFVLDVDQGSSGSLGIEIQQVDFSK